MNWLRRIVSGLRALLRKEQSNRELDQELAQFLDASIAHHRRCGMSAAEARRAATKATKAAKAAKSTKAGKSGATA